jgi:hypothetical protein
MEVNIGTRHGRRVETEVGVSFPMSVSAGLQEALTVDSGVEGTDSGGRLVPMA